MFNLIYSQNIFNKAILFSDKPKTPLIYRGLSNHFYDRMLFGEVDNTETALLNRFKVTKFPTLLIYQTHDNDIKLDDPRVIIYEGKINIHDIVAFLEKYCLPQKTYINYNEKDSLLNKEKAEVRKVNSENFRDTFSSLYERRVIVSFTKDGEFPKELNSFSKLTR